MFDPKQALLGIVKSVLPRLSGHLAEMEKPESGVLQPGEDKMAYIITQNQGDLVIALCPLAFDRANNRMIVGKPLNTQPLEKTLKNADAINGLIGDLAGAGAEEEE